ncbi:hypothetical protein [Micromonospora sp. NPDC006431]|uniref:hypothetical protein n=1 Tax=Micromonospora sp. NPDC006431 TaxID=3364235 RepID=UPI0036BAC4A4
MKAELRSVPDCPHLAQVRQTLHAALADLGPPVVVTEVVGEYPSPTILINDVDVMGRTGDGPAACRLDLPTAERIRAALRQAIAAEHIGWNTALDLGKGGLPPWSTTDASGVARSLAA